MTINSFVRCDLCGTKIRFRWQVGYDPNVVVYVKCPKCSSPIEAEFNGLFTSTKMNNIYGATEIFESQADYCQEISGEFFCLKMTKNSDVPIKTQFLRNSFLFENDNKRKYYGRLLEYAQNIKLYKNEILQIASLIKNKKYDLLKRKINNNENNLVQLFRKFNICDILQNDYDYFKCYYEYIKFLLDNIILFDAKIDHKNIDEKLDVLVNKMKKQLKEFSVKIVKNGIADSINSKFITITHEYLDLFKGLLPIYLVEFDLSKKNLEKNGITTIEYSKLESFYKKCYEFITDNSFVIIALNNLYERNDINQFFNKRDNVINIMKMCKSKYNVFINNIKKDEFLSSFFVGSLDNIVRNSEAHFLTEYDIITQKITFKNKNGKGEIRNIKKYLAEFAKENIQIYMKCYYLWNISMRLIEINYLKNEGFFPHFKMKRNF